MVDVAKLASPTLTLRRSVGDKLKQHYFSNPAALPKVFRLQLVAQSSEEAAGKKALTRFSSDEPFMALLEAFSDAIAQGQEQAWLPFVLATPVTVTYDPKLDELEMQKLTMQHAEDLVKAGQLSSKTPLVRVSEVARVAQLLTANGKTPVTNQSIADWFAQASGFLCKPWSLNPKPQSLSPRPY